jgi:uncharacterized membrane protein
MVLEVNGPRRVPHPTKSDRSPHDLASPAATVDARESVKVERAVTINAPREALYAFWHDFTNLPRFMKHIETVQVRDERHSHWRMSLPAGRHIEWDSEIINDLPNELIAWKTVGTSDVAHAGSVHFVPAPGGRGTEVRLVMDYEPPGGRPGHMLSKLFGVSPEQMIRDDLQRLKQLAESGDLATSAGRKQGRTKP